VVLTTTLGLGQSVYPDIALHISNYYIIIEGQYIMFILSPNLVAFSHILIFYAGLDA
jgi:hypothetical protein